MISLPKAGKRLARLAVWAGVYLAFVRCVEDQVTTPTQGPELVVRGWDTITGPGCPSEVIRTTTDETETILVTFNVSWIPEQTSCRPNLVEWGIDLSDPMPVDTPQGNGFFAVNDGFEAANMPSPPNVAYGAFYTPPQVMIEFDPPVRKVEFYYSRLRGQSAWWPGQPGGPIVSADSMMVWAVSRFPGTLSYWTWDSEKIWSNVTSFAPPWNVWTPVTLQTGGADGIQWLWFDGQIVIDDLKITRAPLSCPGSVLRGAILTCKLTGNYSVTGWSFNPDGIPNIPQLPQVQDSSTSKEWFGRVAVGGEVTVSVMDGITPRTFKKRFSVTDRPSLWASMRTYRQGPETTAPFAEPQTTVPLGRNCPEVNGTVMCVNTLRVQPDPNQLRPDGYTPSEIPDGPNRGYWYVQASTWNMKRVGNLNPAVLASSSLTHQLPSTVPKKCRQGLGFPNNVPVFANFYRYNEKCQSVNMANFVSALWGHEGFGFSGGTGHEGLAKQAADQAQNVSCLS